MPVPEFSDGERYLIGFLKSKTAADSSKRYMWGYVAPCSIFAGVGAYNSDIQLVLMAFVVVVGFRIYEEVSLSRWWPHWRSIIEKYEAAISGNAEDEN